MAAIVGRCRRKSIARSALLPAASVATLLVCSLPRLRFSNQAAPLNFVAPLPEQALQSLQEAPQAAAEPPLQRRGVVSLLGAAAAAAGQPFDRYLPAVAVDDDIKKSPRFNIYRGKVDSLRKSSEWYRFLVGDLISKGKGENVIDGMAADDVNCGGGLCAAATALTTVLKILSPGLARNGLAELSQVEYQLISPMNQMVDMNVWDPDTCDSGKDQVRAFEQSLRKFRASVKTKKDGVEAERLYLKSLDELNSFILIANQGTEATPNDEQFIPVVPKTQEGVTGDEYWQSRRDAFDEERDPANNFRERNAIGSKDFRQGLKRFPGATLLLR